ncbi:NADPH-dependent oxidoreductase [Peptostreptococcus faecalis]|uniref:NADPH-dependent oxidoreductase n=1 Tax=Peptostreptococcus faecalis TaxID=2045015 RepID=UPI001FA86548|nr:NADPH-dependent oxidoreductase [Peptostreptococcus faecalis]
MSSETIKKQLEHRTIREFKDTPIDKDIVRQLLEVANRTSTSVGMQSYSIIRITDPQKKGKIAEICGQKYVNRLPEFWIFVVDAFRNAKIAAEQNFYPESRNDMDRFFQGFTDASLAAQNVMVAVESLDMGGCFFGSILNDSQQIIEILNLPEYTFPVLGIGFGYPNQNPQLKPRMGLDLKVFENEYKVEDSYLESIKDYDLEMQEYYDLRDSNRRVDSFSKQVISRLTNTIENRLKIINTIRRQGFDLQMEYIPEGEIRTMFKISPKEVKEHSFEESKSGLKLDTNLADLFSKHPYIKSYLLNINPKFNKIKSINSNDELKSTTIEDLSKLGDMPAESLIYMIESRIDEE